MKKFPVFVFILVAVMLGACAPKPSEPVTFSTESVTSGEEVVSPRVVPSVFDCSPMEAVEHEIESSLSLLIEDATGSLPSSVNTCWAIFNLTHGNRTNTLYIVNGWALLNLPVEIFVPWDGDRYFVGGPAEVAAIATIDEDTVIVDGGIYSVYIGNDLIDVVDWSSVKGGAFVNEVRFESSRMAFADGERYWTAYCNGNVYSDGQMEQAVACGQGK